MSKFDLFNEKSGVEMMGMFCGGMILVIVCMFLFAWPLMWAFNVLSPLFGGPQITYWATLAGLFIINVIIGVIRAIFNPTKFE